MYKNDPMLKALFLCLMFLVGLVCIIALKNTYAVQDLHSDLCSDTILRAVAPETLKEPDPASFDTLGHYLKALAVYHKNHTWAILSDGYECKL